MNVYLGDSEITRLCGVLPQIYSAIQNPDTQSEVKVNLSVYIT
jgi:hypothetical protein